MTQPHPYKRILLKLSGEAIMGPSKFGIDSEACKKTAQAIKNIRDQGIEVSIVIGGGNIFRGINLNNIGMDRTPADQMGMLATMINGIALQESLTSLGCDVRVMSAIDCPRFVESYNWRRAQEYLLNGTVLFFVGGTGNPYFTTDTTAAMRASETHADIILKATKVDGVYSSDPLKNADAVKYNQITYSDFLAKRLGVMDATAVALCMSNKIPIFVFNMEMLYNQPINKILTDTHHGTLIHQ